MALEDRQQLHNRVITTIGNTSASNDFRQHKHDQNEALIKSAEAFAAGKTLGMSEEETLAAMSRNLRRQRRADDSLTMNDMRRQMVQSAKVIADPANPAEIQGISLREEPEVDPFGQDQGQYYEYKDGDAQYPEQQRQKTLEKMSDMEDLDDSGRKTYDRYGVKLKAGANPADYDDLAKELDVISGMGASAGDRSAVAPNSALRDAVNQLNAAEAQQAGFMSRLSGVFGGGGNEIPGLTTVRGELEDALADGRTQRGADAALSEVLREKDARRFSTPSAYRRKGYSDVKAALEAEAIGEALYRQTRPGYMTEAQFGDESLDTVTPDRRYIPKPEAAFNSNGIALDPSTGNPIGMQGPTYQTPNNDGGAVLNAPMTTRQWMVEKQPGYSEGGRSFGNYPQVDVTGATTLFADRLRGSNEIFNNVSSNVRSIDEVERAAQAMIGLGGKFSTKEPNPAGGRLITTPQATPDIRGVLNKLRYTPAQEAQLANAMYQMEVAKTAAVNQNGKGQYFTRTGPMGSLQPTEFGGTTPGGAQVFFNAPEAVDPRDGQAPVARVNPGQTIEGRDIVTAFKGLPSTGAQQPFIGQVEGEQPRINRYNRTGETSPIAIESALRKQEQENAYKAAKTKAKKDPRAIVRPADQQPVDEQALRGKVVKAQLTQERANRAAKKRQEKERTISQFSMANPANIGRVTPARRRI